MTIQQIHIEIEQGLQNIGIFEYADMLHDEIDIAINAVVYKEIRSLWYDIDEKRDSKNFENNQFHTDFLRLLKVKNCQTPVKTTDGYKITLPNDYLHLISDTTNVIAKECKGKVVTTLEIGKWYRATGDVLSNGIWYKKCDYFKATGTDVYGDSVEEVPTSVRTNRLTKSEDLPTILQNSFTKSNFKSPVSELVGNELFVYSKNFDVAEICINYLKKPTNVNFFTNTSLVEFNDDIQKYIIEKTIQHLAIRSEQNQQKIVNLKHENLE